MAKASWGASRRAAALTHRLLAFSRRQTLDPKPTDVNRLVAGMEDLVRRTVGPEIAVEVVAGHGLWNTLVDPNQLENALLDLCINARDAMPDGGRLAIETANQRFDEPMARERDLPPGQYVSLSVIDSGGGMAPDVIRRAFDPFFTTKPIGMGTGLGLSMIYGFARQSGGQARIMSEVGQGTIFSLYLPQCAGEAAAGLKVVRSDARIDLLITDIGLPGGLNGWQVADAARAARPGLKALLVTGYTEKAAVAPLGEGMAMLTKPFSLEALASRAKGPLLHSGRR